MSGRPGPRGRRVVMLVDNGVVGDSRVQKQARSMAERGWQVTLVGRRLASSAAARPEVEGVRVRLVEVKARAGMRGHRPAWTRQPLAYPTTRHEARADALADAALVRAREMSARGSLAGEEAVVARAWRRARVAGALARRRVVDRRLQASVDLRARRQTGTGGLDRLATEAWSRALGARAWQRLDPGLWDWELAYGPHLDRLRPDIIHANDARMLAVAVRAKLRAAVHGRHVSVVWDAHEYLAGVAPWAADARWQPAIVALQHEYAPFADAAITVSDTLSAMLQRDHDLATPPVVVLNAPEVGVPRRLDTDVRSSCGLGPDDTLVVYSGGAKESRGLGLVVEALAELRHVHAALVVLRSPGAPMSPYVASLVARARELGVADRLHVLPYVPVPDVVPFLSTADVGVFPGLDYLNHRISLVTKFLEYSQARLPIVVSELETMARTVRRTGQGEVFPCEDLDELVRAIEKVLADPASYRRAYDDDSLMRTWTWDHQAQVLDEVYRSVAPPDARD